MHAADEAPASPGERGFTPDLTPKFERMLNFYEKWVRTGVLIARAQFLVGFLVVFFSEFSLFPFVGVSFFPRTDAGQFVINVKAPTGTRIELTENYVKQVEDIVRQVVPPGELEHDRLQYRRDAGSVLVVHSQFRHAHGFRPGGPQGGSQGRAASITWTAVRDRHRQRTAAAAHLFSIRRLGGRGPESGRCPRRSTCRSAAWI